MSNEWAIAISMVALTIDVVTIILLYHKLGKKPHPGPDLEFTQLFLSFVKDLTADNVFIEFETYRRTHDEGKISDAAFKKLVNESASRTYTAINAYYESFKPKLAVDIQYINKYIIDITILSGEKILQDIAMGQ